MPCTPPRRVVVWRLPSLRDLLARELTIAEATLVLMTSFFVSALLGQVLGEAGSAAGCSQAGVAGRFHRRLAKLTATPWTMATGEDSRNLVEATAGTRQAAPGCAAQRTGRRT